MSGSVHGTIAAQEILGPNGGLDPAQGALLAERVIERTCGPREQVAVDFDGVGAISSGFANAFFLKLQSVQPLDDWRRRLIFIRLDALQSQIMRSSREAAPRFPPLGGR